MRVAIGVLVVDREGARGEGEVIVEFEGRGDFVLEGDSVEDTVEEGEALADGDEVVVTVDVFVVSVDFEDEAESGPVDEAEIVARSEELARGVTVGRTEAERLRLAIVTVGKTLDVGTRTERVGSAEADSVGRAVGVRDRQSTEGEGGGVG